MWSTPNRAREASHESCTYSASPRIDRWVVSSPGQCRTWWQGRPRPSGGNRASHQLLVDRGPEHIGGVEQGDPEVERGVDGGNRLRFVSRAIALAHPHASESLGRHHRSAGAQYASGTCHIPTLPTGWVIPPRPGHVRGSQS